MNRTFHSKVSWLYWLVMTLTAFCLFDFFWFHQLLLTFLFAIIMIMEIEMLIHTQYIVTVEGMLQIETGRFIPNTCVDVARITDICRVKSFALAPALSFKRLKIIYQKGGKSAFVFISPKNEDDFVKWICKKNPDIRYN